MVEFGRCCYPDHAPPQIRKDIEYEHAGVFFSNKYENRSDLFEQLYVWKEEKFRRLQGTYPVMFLSFAGIKGTSYADTVLGIKKQISGLYSRYPELTEVLEKREKETYEKISDSMEDVEAAYALNFLSTLLERYYKKNVLIFLDEYDTPLQEAYINGYWDELTAFIRSLFNDTFKTNPSMERAVMTGITRVSRESIFSDLNNLVVVTTTSDKYAASFGFTEEEVFNAVDEQGIDPNEKATIKNGMTDLLLESMRIFTIHGPSQCILIVVSMDLIGQIPVETD